MPRQKAGSGSPVKSSSQWALSYGTIWHPGPLRFGIVQWKSHVAQLHSSSQQYEHAVLWKVQRHSFCSEKGGGSEACEIFPSGERYSAFNDILDWNSWFSGRGHSKTYLSSPFHAHICSLEAFLEKATKPACCCGLPLWLMCVTSEEWHKDGTCCMLQGFKLMETFKGPNGEVTDLFTSFCRPSLMECTV